MVPAEWNLTLTVITTIDYESIDLHTSLYGDGYGGWGKESNFTTYGLSGKTYSCQSTLYISQQL